jgi:hypothetical protein
MMCCVDVCDDEGVMMCLCAVLCCAVGGGVREQEAAGEVPLHLLQAAQPQGDALSTSLSLTCIQDRAEVIVLVRHVYKQCTRARMRFSLSLSMIAPLCH